jgi:hypothetical protein
MWIWYIILPLAGLTLGWIIRWLYARFQLTASEQRAERIKQDAIKEAEARRKEILLEAKEQVIRERNQQERETRERRAELQRYERRVLQKEETIDKKPPRLSGPNRSSLTRKNPTRTVKKPWARKRIVTGLNWSASPASAPNRPRP